MVEAAGFVLNNEMKELCLPGIGVHALAYKSYAVWCRASTDIGESACMDVLNQMFEGLGK